jgi:hypothetical protein
MEGFARTLQGSGHAKSLAGKLAGALSKVSFDDEVAKVQKPPVPEFYGKPLGPGEFDVAVAYAAPDASWAGTFVKVLKENLGLKVSTDQATFPKCRCFIVVVSEDTEKDDSVVRVTTNAAERFNR